MVLHTRRRHATLPSIRVALTVLAMATGRQATAIVVHDITVARLGTILGVLETFDSIGYMVGPPLGGWLYEAGGFLLPFLVLGGVMLVQLPLLRVLLPPSVARTPRATNAAALGELRRVLCIPRVLVASIAGAIGIGVLGFLEPTLAPHLQATIAASPGAIGFLFLGISGSYALCAPLIGWCCDRIGRHAYAAPPTAAARALFGRCTDVCIDPARRGTERSSLPVWRCPVPVWCYSGRCRCSVRHRCGGRRCASCMRAHAAPRGTVSPNGPFPNAMWLNALSLVTLGIGAALVVVPSLPELIAVAKTQPPAHAHHARGADGGGDAEDAEATRPLIGGGGTAASLNADPPSNAVDDEGKPATTEDALSGLLMGAMSLGGALGPVIGGLLVQHFSFGWASAGFGLFTCSWGGLYLLLLPCRRPCCRPSARGV